MTQQEKALNLPLITSHVLEAMKVHNHYHSQHT